MKTAIYGAGALGTVMGALLTQKGVDIDLITRNAEHARAMKEHGAVIYGLINETIPVHAMTPDEMQERYDINTSFNLTLSLGRITISPG